MTVSKAYSILKNEGYIEIDRRHGAKVKPKLDNSQKFKEYVENELSLLITESRLKGISFNDFLNMSNSIFIAMKGLRTLGGEIQ